MGNIVNKNAFLPPPCQPIIQRDKIIWLTTKQEYIVPAILVKGPRQPPRSTMLFSHGNAEDLGCVERWLEELAGVCDADILAYDYPGYGLSRNSIATAPMLMNEIGAYGAAEAAYEYLTNDLNIPPNKIVPFGRSLGTGPTVYLASKYDVKGAVLQSPLLSAVRVVMNTPKTMWFDIFSNVDKISKVKCPVLIIHGDRDEVINVRHGQVLHSMLKNPYSPLWIVGAGHNDIEISYFDQFSKKLKEFFNFLETAPETPLLQSKQ